MRNKSTVSTRLKKKGLSHQQASAYKPLIKTLPVEKPNTAPEESDIYRLLANHDIIKFSRCELLRKSPDDTRWEVKDRVSGARYQVRKIKDQYKIYMSLHVVNQIVDTGLCVRCGACEPACPENIIFFKQDCLPYITDVSDCPTACNRCLKVCPGEFVDFSALDEEMFGRAPHPESITGIVQQAVVSYATDNKVRDRGTSGGLVTQILVYLLETGKIDGALVLGSEYSEGNWQQRSYIARSSDDIKQATKSKYMVTPFLRPLGEIERVEGRYAVVGLPCYLHAVKKYQRVSSKLRNRIVLTIGLFCNAAFRPELPKDLCRLAHKSRQDLQELSFREGPWPGGMLTEFKNETPFPVLGLEDMRDEFNLLKTLYTAPRCNMCIDYTAEYADISVGDPWLRDPQGQLIHEDCRSVALVRTQAGAEVIEQAQQTGYLSTSDLPLHEFMINFEQLARFKRTFVPRYIRFSKSIGRATPDYNRQITEGKSNLVNAFVPRLVLIALSTRRWFRLGVLRIARTPLALKLLAWNRAKKDRKFARRYQTMSQFVERILSPTPADYHPADNADNP